MWRSDVWERKGFKLYVNVLPWWVQCLDTNVIHLFVPLPSAFSCKRKGKVFKFKHTLFSSCKHCNWPLWPCRDTQISSVHSACKVCQLRTARFTGITGRKGCLTLYPVLYAVWWYNSQLTQFKHVRWCSYQFYIVSWCAKNLFYQLSGQLSTCPPETALSTITYDLMCMISSAENLWKPHPCIQYIHLKKIYIYIPPITASNAFLVIWKLKKLQSMELLVEDKVKIVKTVFC